ncbi:MAG: hypothetical protein HGA19_22890 [Oscillochloris sp.]|nr:hypothetical protein [Oscillochloris sp.]
MSALMFNAYALRYGDHVIAAFGVANRVVQICEFLGTGLFTGVIPLIAFAYTAGNQQRLDAVLRTTTLAFMGVTLVIGLPLYLFRQQIFSLFSSDPHVLTVGFLILSAMLVSTLFTGFSSIISGMFQAFGAGLEANIMAVIRGLALIPIIFLGDLWFGLNGVIWSLPAAEIGACVVGMVVWLSSRKRIMSVSLEKRTPLVPSEA